jgi:predicted RNase H-like HicB family nuclease
MAPVPARVRIALHRTKRGYIAVVLDFPGCFSRGASEVEAVENARASVRAYLHLRRLLASERPAVELEISA